MKRSGISGNLWRGAIRPSVCQSVFAQEIASSTLEKRRSPMQAYAVPVYSSRRSDDVQRKHRLHIACLGFLLAIIASSSLAFAQQPTKIRMARLAFPSMSSLLMDVLMQRGIDKKHGIELEAVSQNAVPVYYASIANGDADVIVGGPHVFQKMI